ncbi:unnamed protein product [Rodentolepis nana]|uniref:BZIP domain-containing protein n=1 Tax=Rodentolepis nana TaxID=102285 RepID=A0A0R3T4W5_RODNA|nr:unnamed protein product [Rodentolepis nana]
MKLEARSIKLVVIYLALGCPERIRFEYDYVNVDGGSSGCEGSITPAQNLNPTFTAPLSREAIANGEGMTNGLRRLLHLSASEYLNLKSFNQPARAVPAASTKPPDVDDPKKTAGSSISPMKEQTKNAEPGSSINASASQEFVTPTAPIYGLVYYGEGKNTKRKFAVARNLDMVGPAKVPASDPPPSTSSNQVETISSLESPTKIAEAVVAAAAPHIRSETSQPLPEQPATSLDALRLFNQNQARRYRERLTAVRKQKALARAQAQRVVPAYKVLPHVEEKEQTPIVSNQDLSLPSVIDSCSNTSGNESIISLLNAFMTNDPQGLDQTQHDQNQQQLPSLQEENHEQQMDQKPIVVPSEFYQCTQADNMQPHEESNSSLSTFIRNLTAGAQVFTTDTPVEIVNLDDSIQQKICRDMMRPPDSSSVDVPTHQVYNVIPNLESNAPPLSNDVSLSGAFIAANPLMSPQIHGDDTLEYLQNQDDNFRQTATLQLIAICSTFFLVVYLQLAPGGEGAGWGAPTAPQRVWRLYGSWNLDNFPKISKVQWCVSEAELRISVVNSFLNIDCLSLFIVFFSIKLCCCPIVDFTVKSQYLWERFDCLIRGNSLEFTVNVSNELCPVLLFNSPKFGSCKMPINFRRLCYLLQQIL